MPPMPLSDLAIRKAKTAEKPCHTFEGGALYVEVMPTGGKL